ncbi:MAG: hypothetical protein LAO05_04690 [Acidobacteriia bacterium]|nr:hypothetical protein [Terriglobia bacterium]
MRTVWLPLIAEVEWSAGGRGQERPLALRCGGERVGLRVDKGWTDGPVNAAAPVWRVFLALDTLGRRLRIRADAEGRTRVEVETPG